MAVSHVFVSPIADATGTVTVWDGATTASAVATNLVRPSDYNSAHNQYATLTGNTAGSSTVSGTNLVYGASNGISLSASSAAGVATIWIQGVPPASTYEPYPYIGLSTASVAAGNATSAAVSVFPFRVDEAVSAGILNMMFSMAFLTVGTSSGRQSMGCAVGIYTRGTGANSTSMGTLASQSFSLAITGNNSSYTISQPTSSGYGGYTYSTTNSAGVNISSGYTGMKLVGFPINTLMTAGDYWLGTMCTNSTSSVNVGVSLSFHGAVMATAGTALGPIGSFSSAFSTGNNPAGGRWMVGNGSWSSAGSVTNVPVSMGFASISAGGATVHPFMNFWRT